MHEASVAMQVATDRRGADEAPSDESQSSSGHRQVRHTHAHRSETTQEQCTSLFVCLIICITSIFNNIVQEHHTEVR